LVLVSYLMLWCEVMIDSCVSERECRSVSVGGTYGNAARL